MHNYPRFIDKTEMCIQGGLGLVSETYLGLLETESVAHAVFEVKRRSLVDFIFCLSLRG